MAPGYTVLSNIINGKSLHLLEEERTLPTNELADSSGNKSGVLSILIGVGTVTIKTSVPARSLSRQY